MNTATAFIIGAMATLTPTVTCIIAYLLPRQDLRDLCAEVRSRLDAQDMKFAVVDARFSAIDAKFAELKESIHQDALGIMRT